MIVAMQDGAKRRPDTDVVEHLVEDGICGAPERLGCGRRFWRRWGARHDFDMRDLEVLPECRKFTG